MPCLTPYRGDTSQMLLFKIASCLEANPGGSVTAASIIAALGCTPACEGDVVNSFNTRVGDVVLTLADVSAVADGRYVLKAGDTMTGALLHPDGTAPLPSISFSGDPDTGIYRVGANSLGFSTSGSLAWTLDSGGFLYGNTGRYIVSPGGFYTVDTGAGFLVYDYVPGLPAKHLLRNATGDVSVLIGGTTSAFPSIKRSAATIQFRLADDSAFADISTAAIVMSTAAPLSVTSGANQRAGDVVLVAGTVTTANTTVTANTRVYTSRKTAGGVLGNLTYTLIAATSFTITSDNVADTSTVSYLLIEVP